MTRKSRDCQYSSDFNTRSVDAVEQMDVLFSLRDFPDFNILHSGWRRFPVLTQVISLLFPMLSLVSFLFVHVTDHPSISIK